MPNLLFLPELREMLAANDRAGLEAVMEFHSATIAEWADGLTVEETWKLFDHAPIAKQAEVFTFLDPAYEEEMVSGIGRERMSKLIEAMPHDERVDLIKRLGPAIADTILPLVAKADRQDIATLLSYKEDSAGAIMTSDYAWLPPDIPVSEAITRLRQQADRSETIYYIYVLDDLRRLLGIVSLHELILAKPSALVRDVMSTDTIAVRADQDQEEVARLMAKFDFLAIPVVDAENHLVGIVTHDDALDVIVEEATEDAQRQSSVVPMDENYLEVPFITTWYNRSIWLACLFLAELFTFTALAGYEHAIAQIVVLSLFVPLCISTGGNSGSQAATLVTRAMALGHIKLEDWWRLISHELGMGLALGVTLGAIGFVRAALTPESVLGIADRWTLAWVIAQSVALICLWGTVVGATLPLIFKRLGIDPAYAGSPFVATFVDVTGILIYFTIATLYLPVHAAASSGDWLETLFLAHAG